MLGYAEASKLKLLGVTPKSVITLHVGSLSQRPIEWELHYNASQQKAGALQGNNIHLEGWMRSTGMSG